MSKLDALTAELLWRAGPNLTLKILTHINSGKHISPPYRDSFFLDWVQAQKNPSLSRVHRAIGWTHISQLILLISQLKKDLDNEHVQQNI